MSRLPAERPPLPIDPVLPAACAAVAAHGRLVLTAEPGAGKTTRLPAALLDASGPAGGSVLVVEPRRIAAVLAARFVAAERGEPIGKTVGYAVRFDEATGPQTRLCYLTDGLLLRRLAADPMLRGVGTVVLDELHERRLATDLALALLRRLQQGARPDLKLVAMSATLDAGAVAGFLGDCPVLHAPGRVFPVAVTFAPTTDSRPLETQVASAVRSLVDDGLDGDVLVFLPGAAEIRRCAQALANLAGQCDLALRPLHGALPQAEQDLALQPEPRRKVILATNLAETSVTLPGVVAVVDSGLHRSAGHAAWSGLPTLQVARVSKASATQRAGRAGRLRPGRCLRLYTQHDHDGRPQFDKPEVLRADLTEPLLLLAALGVEAQAPDLWLTPPPPEAIQAGRNVLCDLGALDATGAVTAMGRRLLRFPLHPRLARVLVEAVDRGVGDEGCLCAALLGERDLRTGAADPGRIPHGFSDVAALAEAFTAAEQGRFDARTLRDLGLDAGAARQVQRVRDQLRAAVRGDVGSRQKPPPSAAVAREEALAIAVLTGFGDRLARRRSPGSVELELAGGLPLRLGPRSEASEPMLLAIVDAEERRETRSVPPLQGRAPSGNSKAQQRAPVAASTTEVRIASGVEAAWLLDLYPERIDDERLLTWDDATGRVLQHERLLYRGLVLDASVQPAPADEKAAALLHGAVRAAGLGAVTDAEGLEALRLRLAFAREHAGLHDLPALEDADVDAALGQLCQGRTALGQVRAADLLALLQGQVAAACGGKGQRLLDETAPAALTLPGGRRLRLHYAAGQMPWIASRLQDFFGQAQGPRIASGRVAVVLHLLAPNQRPVQVTTDLAGFWLRHYPTLRKELGRRYPRHAWPEDPLRP